MVRRVEDRSTRNTTSISWRLLQDRALRTVLEDCQTVSAAVHPVAAADIRLQRRSLG